MRYFAELLMSHEARGQAASRPAGPTAIPVIDKLRPELATLMGKSGFRALLLRALALAGAESPELGGLQVTAQGTLEEVDGVAATTADPADMAAGKMALVARLLGLLETFIGEVLTLQLVRGIWPDVPLEEYFKQGDENDITT